MGADAKVALIEQYAEELCDNRWGVGTYWRKKGGKPINRSYWRRMAKAQLAADLAKLAKLDRHHNLLLREPQA